jgi:hypothetical protein
LASKIKTFLKLRGDEKAELEDEEWLFDLAFLADFTGKLSDMNIELRGKNKRTAEMMSTFSSYKSKFELIMTDLIKNTFDHLCESAFSCLKMTKSKRRSIMTDLQDSLKLALTQ